MGVNKIHNLKKQTTSPLPPAPEEPLSFTSYQKFVVAVLAFLQFTIILDFMIISPLGAILMPALGMTTSQFGLVVSAYAFSAGASGLLAAGFADRFDRKKLLLFFYTGFIIGTLLCALAPTYQFLLAARMVTGLFGGVIGSIVYAITTDLFPMAMRGRVMGYVQSAFSASQILGIPFGVFLSTHFGWHSTFLMIVVTSSIAAVLIASRLRPIDDHLKLQVVRSPVRHLFGTLRRPRYLHGFATIALLSTGGFMLMPFGSAFSVYNLKIGMESLPLVYMVTGLCTFFAGPFIGRASDRIGKFKTFFAGSLLSMLMVLVYTHLGETHIGLVILVSVALFIGISTRMIASQAMMSAIPDPGDRGSYMSVSSSIQQVSGGIASVLAGMIVVQNGENPLVNFDVLGYVVSGAIVVTVVMMYSIKRSYNI